MPKDKTIVRLAVLRDDNDNPCPFGLPISHACKTAGRLVDKMAPLAILGKDVSDWEKDIIASANVHLLIYNSPNEICKFAGNLIESNKDIVECNWDSVAAGVHEKGSLRGSAYYPRFFSGIGVDGLFSYPLGYYSDSGKSRHRYYGLFGLEGSDDRDELTKISEEDVNKVKKDGSD